MRILLARRVAIVGIVLWCIALAPAVLNGQSASGQKAGPAPTVTAQEMAALTEYSYRVSNDPPARVPNHPPIDQVPPKPMPNNPDWSAAKPANSSPGQGVIYNPATRQQVLAPLDFQAAKAAFAAGGGYNGADGGQGYESTPATMGGMTLLSAATRAQFPYRMNVKLLMRWGTSYFVCSGSMRNASTVLTAGHCVYDTGLNQWADEIWVYPAWDGVGSLFGPPTVVNPYGWAHSTALGSWTGWTVSHDFNFDIGAVGLDRAAGFLTGWFGWAWGFDCNFAQTTFYNSGSYPAESCGGGLHTGADMYFWGGSFDTCPNTNRLGLFTPIHGCLGAVWGGMSGSGAYYLDGSGNRFTHAVTSTSNRFDYAEYTRQWEDWINFLNGSFDPVSVQGPTFDLQPLNVAGPATFIAGQNTGGLTHVAANATQGAKNATFTFRVYLSTNDNIETTDTLVSTQTYGFNFGAVSSANINMAGVTIPANTPPGTYYLGVIYDNATDGNTGNNDTDGWDALKITVQSADVAMSLLSAPPQGSPGSSYTVNNTVINNGTAPTGSFRIGLYLSPTSTCSAATGTLIGSRAVALAGGASSNADTLVSIPAGAALGPAFICAIADDLSAVGEYNETNNTRSVAFNVVSATPILTLKINGQHPNPPVVSTTGPVALTLSISPTTYTAALDWYWAIVVNGAVSWITPGGLTSVPTPLAHQAPLVLTNASLANLTLPRGTTFTAAFFLVNGSTVVSSDFITAQVPAAATQDH
ncbi:MAG TPA: CARDB domain-containing protein [Vicinamibacterales bacterium]